MPTLTAPLLSMRASGEIAGSIQYSTWRGKPVARMKPVAKDAGSTAQLVQRSAFSDALPRWSFEEDTRSMKQPWNFYAAASHKRNSGWNEFLSVYLPGWPIDGDFGLMAYPAFFENNEVEIPAISWHTMGSGTESGPAFLIGGLTPLDVSKTVDATMSYGYVDTANLYDFGDPGQTIYFRVWKSIPGLGLWPRSGLYSNLLT